MISPNIEETKSYLQKRFANCADVMIRSFINEENEKECILLFVEGTLNSKELSDLVELEDMDQAIAAMLAGNTILFVDGSTKPVKISSKGYPGMGVSESKTERSLRGAKEGFSDAVKVNLNLVRKRLRDSRLKVKEFYIGNRSSTLVTVLYMEDIVYPEILQEVEKRLSSVKTDAIEDVGMVEQLTEKTWYSPFPQFQTTEHPDKAALELLNGRVLILSDNSPTGLLCPTTFNDMLKVGEDMYRRFGIVSFLRLLRYLAVLFTMLLPGLYLAITTFHTELIPAKLILSFAEARQGVPFWSIFEILLMELAFELIREAGIRMPGQIGPTIGIIGGLIVGQAAINANIVSPIVVVVVALTALSSFAIPNEEFSAAFRLIKYGFLALGGLLGMFGLILGIFVLIQHMCTLKSFSIPFLMPFVGGELNGKADISDSLLRVPLWKLTKRSITARKENRNRT